MCSIYGWIPHDGRGDASAMDSCARRVSDVMRFRGPDDRGWNVLMEGGRWADQSSPQRGAARAMLGQNRLSIIDLSPGGHQPKRSPDGKATIVFNGEIYNYIELRSELAGLGHRFETESDTEVLLEAYREWGDGALSRLVGMFAFAVIDAERGEIFLARDFFGIKPLYYGFGSQGFCFASELPALLEFPGIGKKLNPGKAYDYLVNLATDVDDGTMVDGVYQLPPAHCMRVSLDGRTVKERRRYWKIDLENKRDVTFAKAASEMRELFLESVRLHLRSDVPLGIALSGGIDSSAVACAVRHLEPDLPIRTFSYIAADSPELSEEKWIDLVNERIGAVPNKVYVKSTELFDDLDQLVARQGEPFGGTSIYAQYRVFKLAREKGVTVSLDGQGADELLAGYYGYPADRIESLVRRGRLGEAYHFWNETCKWPGRDRKGVAMSVLKRLTPKALHGLSGSLRKRNRPVWLNAAYLEEKGVRCAPYELECVYRSRDKLRLALARAATQQGLPRLLRHGDRNSMTSSIESRVPFCNREFAEYALSLPEEYLEDGTGRTKAVFREAMRGIVPDAILDRRDKIGFETPEKDWFPRLSAWVRPILAMARSSRLLDGTVVESAWEDIAAGRTAFGETHWRLMNYLTWKEALGIEE